MSAPPVPMPPAMPAPMPATPMAPLGVAPPQPAASGSGWWRRNRWGVLALVPVLAVTFFLPVKELYDDYTTRTPVRPIAAGADGWASFNGARIRLVELAPLIDLRSSNGEPYSPGPGVRGWRATIAFEATNPVEMLGACKLMLEDEAGRQYEAGPTELIGARLPTVSSFPTCVPAKEDNAPLPTKYELPVYFVMPSSAYPAAVRIWLITGLPDYARLPAY
jgi:hypothetical protein